VSSRPTPWVGLAACLVASLGLAASLDDYTLYRFTLAGIYAIAIIGLNLLLGLSGQFSIGHGAFFALGAYVTAITTRDSDTSAYLTILMAGGCGFVAGYLFGWPALRLSLIHLTLATWALAVALPQVLKSSHLETWTGGVQGLYLDRPGAPDAIPLSDDQWWHLVVTAILLVLIWLAHNLRHGRSARALTALRDNEIAAAMSGVNVARYKTIIFGISAFYAAIAGALAALLTDFVGPDSFTVWLSIHLLIGAVIGGMHSVWGALIGGMLLQFLPDAVRSASSALSFPAYGFILILMVYLSPDGLAGLIGRTAQRLRRLFGRSAD